MSTRMRMLRMKEKAGVMEIIVMVVYECPVFVQ
jgi:hypothetical protein